MLKSSISKFTFALILLTLLQSSLINAKETVYSGSLSLSQTLAAGTSENNSDLSRITLLPTFEAKMSSGWRSKVALRLERFDGDTGLGTLDTFDSMSEPWDLNDRTYLELDRATLTWRKRSTRITLGKQTFAWGVLDGIQVTDRFDATRKREAIFIDQRPDRIARWGARAQFRFSKIRWDLGILADGTGDQLATLGSTYEVKAPRFRAGLTAEQPLPEINIETLNDLTFGIRGSSRWGKSDISLLAIHGPDPEPLFAVGESGINVRYESRTLIGGTLQRAEGARVWRVEVASVRDQPVNTNENGISIDDRKRLLAGIGLDWDLPKSTFLNLQLGIDNISGNQLFRPETDIISTIKLQRSFMNDSLKLSAELIGSLRENDGTFRPAIYWQVNDSIYLQGGLDVVWGENDGLIGQFNKTDRIWLKATWEI